jgi:hypothetical protein
LLTHRLAGHANCHSVRGNTNRDDWSSIAVDLDVPQHDVIQPDAVLTIDLSGGTLVFDGNIGDIGLLAGAWRVR